MIKKKRKVAGRKARARNAHKIRLHDAGHHVAKKISKRKKAPDYDIDAAKEGYVSGDQPIPRYYEF
jgi:hypothetical protein